jgi:hypothetical protein
MKRRKKTFIVLAVIIVILIIGAVLIFTPKKITNTSDYIVGLKVFYHESEVPADQDSIIKILSKYEAVTSLNDYYGYQMANVDFEIDFVDNNKSVHIVLGKINFWYGSGSELAHDILNAGQLEDELKNALNLK